MRTLAFVEINLFAMAILLIIFLNVKKKDVRHVLQQRLYVALLLSTMAVLASDTAILLLDGTQHRGANLAAGTLYYVLCPVPCMLWYLYADFQIHCDQERLKRLMPLLSVPALLNEVLVLTNMDTGLVFFLDNANMYVRGPAISGVMILSYGYLILAMAEVTIKRARISRDMRFAMLFYPSLPIASGVIQYLNQGLPALWLSTSVSLLMFFLIIQSKQLYTDYLSGLYNRKQLSIFLEECLRQKNRRPLLGIMLDIDNLKGINDTYGHMEGDRAIVCAADVLRASVGEEAFVARFAGDEFIVVQQADRSTMRKTVQAIEENLEALNGRSELPYEIRLSMGYDLLDVKSCKTSEQFIKRIDAMMYEAKREKRTQ